MTYICTLSPLFDIQLVNNVSHIVSLQFHKLRMNLTNDTDSLDEMELEKETEKYFLSAPVVVTELALTLITESKEFHRGIFLLKCLFTPFVVGALLLFCVRMYLNDLYISIPDRLLIAVAFAQIVQNIPVEILLSTFSDRPSSVYLKMLDDFAQILLLISMILFWIVYTKDKLSKNEPWERNTKYYRYILLYLKT